MFRLDGKTAFIFAARGHLGQAMCRALGQAGAHLVVNGCDPDPLAALWDFFAAYSRLDILVNNAVTMQVKGFDALVAEDFARTFQSSVVAAFKSCRAALPALKQAVTESGDASVINIASIYAAFAPDARIYGDRAQQSPFHYGPAKAGPLQLTRHLAPEFGPHCIRANALVPGPFPPAADPVFADRLVAKTMQGRCGKREEIGGPLLFRAAPASSYITGASIAVDGGWTAW